MRPFQNNPFVCALCWVMVDDDIFHCKATLIVMSECTLEQWIDEVNFPLLLLYISRVLIYIKRFVFDFR